MAACRRTMRVSWRKDRSNESIPVAELRPTSQLLTDTVTEASVFWTFSHGG